MTEEIKRAAEVAYLNTMEMTHELVFSRLDTLLVKRLKKKNLIEGIRKVIECVRDCINHIFMVSTVRQFSIFTKELKMVSKFSDKTILLAALDIATTTTSNELAISDDKRPDLITGLKNLIEVY